ncbi:MAG: MFS transporter [Nitrososphaerota archaeon]|nr:MFS transporter [Nitrososphaerota archaeon]MDG6929856.1 MFS transporter [Nitrososphaerota archaeon]
MAVKDTRPGKEASGPSNVNPKGRQNSGEIKLPWLAIFALAMGMLVYGVAESYGPVTAITNIIPSQFYYLSLSLSFIAAGFGALLAGFLTDKLGRKPAFLIIGGMVIVGTAVFLVAPTNAAALIISFILVGMGAIGAETPIITAIAELIPARFRGRLETIVQNFGNIGVAIVFIPALIRLSFAQDLTAYAILLIAPIIALVVGYWAVSESRPWEAVTGKASEDIKQAWKTVDKEEVEAVNPTVGLGRRYFFITLIGIVQDVAFVWIAYDIGYLYFVNYSAVIPVIGGIMMAVVGILAGIFFVHRLPRKTFAVLAYGLLVVLWAILWIYVVSTGNYSGLPLLVIVAILFIPTELTWSARAMLNPELFPTKTRGRWVSFTRAAVWIISGIITLLLSVYYYPGAATQTSSMFNISTAIVMAIFLAGLIMSIVWYFKGFETGRKSLSGFDIKSE